MQTVYFSPIAEQTTDSVSINQIPKDAEAISRGRLKASPLRDRFPVGIREDQAYIKAKDGIKYLFVLHMRKLSFL